ncbi:hypothetical protein EX30DRAFT_396884 [Ascodesmis nigricans]|uniref:Uncharacterized protein n=1 Tax=Ascodesmis nigricans TaxID=341454 RepID=A0A4S2MTK1_9PEZI|nr:hypothetical protein EX30DRAFT_396884 [Ascodesmis nigricans]
MGIGHGSQTVSSTQDSRTGSNPVVGNSISSIIDGKAIPSPTPTSAQRNTLGGTDDTATRTLNPVVGAADNSKKAVDGKMTPSPTPVSAQRGPSHTPTPTPTPTSPYASPEGQKPNESYRPSGADEDTTRSGSLTGSNLVTGAANTSTRPLDGKTPSSPTTMSAQRNPSPSPTPTRPPTSPNASPAGQKPNEVYSPGAYSDVHTNGNINGVKQGYRPGRGFESDSSNTRPTTTISDAKPYPTPDATKTGASHWDESSFRGSNGARSSSSGVAIPQASASVVDKVNSSGLQRSDRTRNSGLNGNNSRDPSPTRTSVAKTVPDVWQWEDPGSDTDYNMGGHVATYGDSRSLGASATYPYSTANDDQQSPIGSPMSSNSGKRRHRVNDFDSDSDSDSQSPYTSRRNRNQGSQGSEDLSGSMSDRGYRQSGQPVGKRRKLSQLHGDFPNTGQGTTTRANLRGKSGDGGSIGTLDTQSSSTDRSRKTTTSNAHRGSHNDAFGNHLVEDPYATGLDVSGPYATESGILGGSDALAGSEDRTTAFHSDKFDQNDISNGLGNLGNLYGQPTSAQIPTATTGPSIRNGLDDANKGSRLYAIGDPTNNNSDLEESVDPEGVGYDSNGDRLGSSQSKPSGRKYTNASIKDGAGGMRLRCGPNIKSAGYSTQARRSGCGGATHMTAGIGSAGKTPIAPTHVTKNYVYHNQHSRNSNTANEVTVINGSDGCNAFWTVVTFGLCRR